MSAGGFGTEHGQPGPDSQAGWPPPPPSYQAGQYGQPLSAQFRRDYAPQVPVARGTNPLAIAALCCGIGQVLAGPLAGIPAIILGAMSLRQIRETGQNGRAMAVVGLVMGIVGVLLVLVIVLFIGLTISIFTR